ncbi:MAG: helix-turn-helix transcriptional regulator [Chloroflexi bacterium]|nr:helix-turn-helix transcriptional regulator [Chloroflexota bacterium]
MTQHIEAVEGAACTPVLAIRLSSAQTDAIAAAFKAIGHPVRMQILDLIAQGGGEVCGCHIERHFDLTQPTISHHLRILRDAGLIESESRGVWVHHRVNRAAMSELQRVLASLADSESKASD